MRELLIISGKGGTGKTTVLGSFAVLAENKILADADVDAPNLHLLLDPQPRSEDEYVGAALAVKNAELCTGCGSCEQSCRFDAISDLEINPRRCEGCGVCAVVCPEGAITMRAEPTGRIFVSDTRHGPLVYARLNPAAEATGKLVTQVRERARRLAHDIGADLILTDGSPGIGCPVIASLAGVDYALVVTEPTPAGRHDMERVLQVAAHFGVPTGLCVNKWDLNPELAEEIEQTGEAVGAVALARIPFDDAVAESTAEGVPLVEYAADGPAKIAIIALWQAVARLL